MTNSRTSTVPDNRHVLNEDLFQECLDLTYDFDLRGDGFYFREDNERVAKIICDFVAAKLEAMHTLIRDATDNQQELTP
jgi:hypothetical protein